LAELHQLAQRFGESERTWVTFDTPQSRSLLDGEEVLYAPPATSRDLIGTARNARFARSLFQSSRFDHVVSTGAAVAVAFLPYARKYGFTAHYIESATRLVGPSLTGKLVAAIPERGIHLYTQHEYWSNNRWRFAGSVFDDFEALPRPERDIRSIVVSLGTHRTYGFARAVRRLAEIIPSHVNVLWQAGITEVRGLDVPLRDVVPVEELQAAIEDADAVVTHAGVGSALTTLKAGKMPVYLPRRRSHREHVDDHQVELARELHGRGLAIWREADEVTWEDIRAATERHVVYEPGSVPFRLSTTRTRQRAEVNGFRVR
jgi:UDP-N-acetylglucosamine transferase subunit ALG13